MVHGGAIAGRSLGTRVSALIAGVDFRMYFSRNDRFLSLRFVLKGSYHFRSLGARVFALSVGVDFRMFFSHCFLSLVF